MSETTTFGAVDVRLEKTHHHIKARAELNLSDGHRFTGVGIAQGAPYQRNLPELANYLAVARALADLSEEVLTAAAADVEADLVASWRLLGQRSGTVHSS